MPSCSHITGTNAITFTRDEGATLASTGTLTGTVSTPGLVALDTANTLLAVHANSLLRSTDAGCTWNTVGTVHSGLTLTAATGGRAYAWAENGSSLYRIDGSTLTALTSPAANILGLGVDAANGSHVRVGDRRGQLYESFNGGASWTAIGVAPVSEDFVLGYTVAFDPANLNHVLYGLAGQGAFVSTNGGSTWTQVKGLSTTRANGFTIAVSPANGQIVWLVGMDLETSTRKLYRSADGGQTFAPVVVESENVSLTNGVLVAPHPKDAQVIYFEFGTYYQDYGTDIYKYNHATGVVTQTHNANDDVSSIAFSPADPSVMYFGLTSVIPS
ncbi:exo-alpha-sialidase [Archangium violaceum]|uniref:WD40/YVTN/BNR-like repeat-containing protein n=1 Tax=Archangium violaceum TaxID=83451 RepID=UPI00193AEE3E|nr:sialidase family protein [Archangium violaceum]QRK12931.1 exo-alpha-sialidase [Archangium violaceum]